MPRVIVTTILTTWEEETYEKIRRDREAGAGSYPLPE
jgi:hypothetical protein